jgi:transposase
VAILAIAATPTKGRALTKARIETALRKAGRRRLLSERVARIYDVLQREQLRQPALLEDAYGVATEATVANIAQLNASIAKLEASLSTHFEQHPSAKVILSLPGMGTVLGARVLGEFGDDPNRYADAKSRKNYAGTSPVTKASGKSRVVLARHSRNKRLASALDQWAFSSLLPSPGARSYYNELKARDKHHRKAIRQLANRWVGILHGCLENDTPYDETIAWSHHRSDVAA